MSRELPIHVRLKGKSVWIFGAGDVAIRKARSLIDGGARITVVATEHAEEFKNWEHTQSLKRIKHDLNDLSGLVGLEEADLAFITTNDAELNQKIHAHCNRLNILCNTADQLAACDFIMPAIVDRSPILVSVGSGGNAPVLSRLIKQKIDRMLPGNLGLVAQKAGGLRDKIKQAFPEFKQRLAFWRRHFHWDDAVSTVNSDTNINTHQLIQSIKQNHTNHKVTLVGAGPGDPELLTVKALKALQQADVVLHDHLISTEILNMIRKDAKLIDVGKQAGHHKTRQEVIHELLVSESAKHQHVVRLKGGDPFVFGRGGEEISALHEADIEYEIVPGITAAMGCAAYSGIPLTHRDHAQSVAFITAHCSRSKDTIDWQFYAKDNQTLAIYMGLIQAEYLTSQLIAHGKKPEEPVAIIENGTRQNQRTVTGQLQQLAGMIEEHQIQSPALIVIGAVAEKANSHNWFERQQEAQINEINNLKIA